MKKDRKSVDLQNTQIWRDNDRTITMAGDFDPVSFNRDRKSWSDCRQKEPYEPNAE